MAHTLYASVLSVGPVLHALRQAEISFEEIGAALGVNPARLADPETRLPLQQLSPIWDWAAQQLSDPNLGLHLAQSARRETFGVFSFVASSCASLEEALQRIQRYFRLLTDAAKYELSKDGEAAWWSIRSTASNAQLSRQSCEFCLAVSCTYTRLWLDEGYKPLAVHFRHPPPPDLSEHERFFRAPVSFGTDRDAVRFDATVLNSRIGGADPTLTMLLERYAEEALAALPAPGRLSEQVRKLMIQNIDDERMSLGFVAERLAMSERSLQRHLREEGTSHQRLFDDVRRELAVRYVANQDLAVSEVAYMLGFSEAAPFFRAFKKWTGQTPREYRRG